MLNARTTLKTMLATYGIMFVVIGNNGESDGLKMFGGLLITAAALLQANEWLNSEPEAAGRPTSGAQRRVARSVKYGETMTGADLRRLFGFNQDDEELLTGTPLTIPGTMTFSGTMYHGDPVNNTAEDLSATYSFGNDNWYHKNNG